ncbi:MAG: bifunctional serine/threonine-protein kinase/formylglycine-generating enzyme family protein [Planctomycetota bacterium]|jgi:serine/threonine protein kinase/formylglycine-generating enzyme required for sulfatase activity/dienelactone hydrolase
MSEAKGQNDKGPKGKGADPTRSFDSSVTGPGSQIGLFRIEQELGRGGAGVVYLAHDTKLGRSVAIKSLPPEVKDNPKALSRFTREATVLASLNHPNIATIYDELEEVEGLTYLVLEYVPGQTLAERIAQGPLKLEETLTIALQIAEAVAAAHEHDVIHRDLKPGNIKITPEGKVKVLDFGLAKAVGGEEVDQQSTITEPGRVIGTPAYMSPEQARGKPADKRSDIWSFGCVLYEMLTATIPFRGETISDTLANILDHDADWELLPAEAGPQVRKVLYKCLEKNPDNRYQSVAQIRRDLYSYQTTLSAKAFDVRLAWRAIRRPRVAVCIILIFLTLGFGVSRLVHHSSKVRWARVKAIPEIERLIEQDEYFAAFFLARKAEKYIAKEPILTEVWPRISRDISIITTPPGADIFFKEYSAIDSQWQYLGQSPIENIRFPIAFSRWRFEKEGFRTMTIAAYPGRISNTQFTLDEKGKIPDEMVRVPGGKFSLDMPNLSHLEEVQSEDYLIDKYEVTNKEFKQFVDSGGYEERQFWKYTFVKNDRILSWEEAMAEFKDKTGRTGPATWEVGDYPDGQADYPVTGISWYEAAAYAEFAGKCLPTIYHWNRAAVTRASSFIIPLSNLDEQGLASVGSYQGMSPFGTYDMAGNAREWCWNESGNQRFILGGGWNDEPYLFNDAFTQPPLDRSYTNGLRCMKYLEPSEDLAALTRPIELLHRDFVNERPVSDQIFNIYLGMYTYDKTELNAVIESVDDHAEDWIREKVSFDAAYSNERVIAYLFLPKVGNPPYQTVVYFPGSGAIHTRSSESLRTRPFDFLIRNGRAVMYPIYKGTYERGDDLNSDYPNETNFYREHVIQWAKDLSRSVDYLETRKDIDTEKLAYYGLSWGGAMGGIMPAVEKRLKVSVLYVAGLVFQRALPEADGINFVSRINVPVLMLNGRYDHFFPLETSQIPMFELLGTPLEHKKHVVYDTGHFVPRNQLVSEILNWLDRYLGPVK